MSSTTFMGRPTDSEFYDGLYSLKDYATEADAVDTVIQERCPGARTLLDVACGTGKHLARLRAAYTVEGLDLDQQLLAGARIRLPDVPLHATDMRDFDLGRRFDAITCLFGSIGYVRMIKSLTGAVRAMARHLEPGES